MVSQSSKHLSWVSESQRKRRLVVAAPSISQLSPLTFRKEVGGSLRRLAGALKEELPLPAAVLESQQLGRR